MSEKSWRESSRLSWTDENWANYLDCPVRNIPDIKTILANNYVMAIERNKMTKQYCFRVYKINKNNKLQLVWSDDKHGFANVIDAVNDANNIIATLELSDSAARALNIPKRALQMMVIREN